MYNQFLDAREKLKNVEPLQKILDAFFRNCRTFVKHHLFDQVWWLGITARMHQKNFTGCVCFRSYQLRALPFCHAWRHVSAANDFPDAYEKFGSLSYHESNLSLIARETMRLLLNHQLIPITMQPKSISLEQICSKRSQGIAISSLHCLLYSTSKNKDLKKISKSALW